MQEKIDKSQQENKKTPPKKERKPINWSLILIFFLLGFMLTIPSMISRMLPSTGSRVAKSGNDVFILVKDNMVLHLKDNGTSFDFVSSLTNGDSPTETALSPELSLSGNKMMVIGEKSVDIYIYDASRKDFVFHKKIDYPME